MRHPIARCEPDCPGWGIFQDDCFSDLHVERCDECWASEADAPEDSYFEEQPEVIKQLEQRRSTCVHLQHAEVIELAKALGIASPEEMPFDHLWDHCLGTARRLYRIARGFGQSGEAESLR
jgi:hypothetical protein